MNVAEIGFADVMGLLVVLRNELMIHPMTPGLFCPCFVSRIYVLLHRRAVFSAKIVLF